jgi:hypothetical protein
MNYYTSNLYSLEKLKLSGKSESVGEQISKIKSEIANLKATIDDNDTIKEGLLDGVENNLKAKGDLKRVLMKLIAGKSVSDNCVTSKLENIVKEKEEIEYRYKKHQQYLNNLILEKESKDNKLSEVTNELEKMKRLLYEKDRKINELENKQKNGLLAQFKFIDYDAQENKALGFIRTDRRQTGSVKYTPNSDRFEKVRTIVKTKSNKISLISSNGDKKSTGTQRESSPKTKRIERLDTETYRKSDGVIVTQLNEIYNKKAKELANKMKKNLNSGGKSNRDGGGKSNRSLSLSCVSVNHEGEGFISELDIVDYIGGNSGSAVVLNAYTRSKPKKQTYPKTDSQYIFNKQTKLIIDNNTFEEEEREIPSPMKSVSKVASAPTKKYINVNRFLSSAGGVQQNKRDYSPGSLQHARMERQIQKGVVVAMKTPQVIVSQNATEFVNEYITKKSLTTEENEQFGTQVVENAINSVMNFNSGNPINPKSDLFKSLNELNEIKKNLKMSRYLVNDSNK